MKTKVESLQGKKLYDVVDDTENAMAEILEAGRKQISVLKKHGLTPHLAYLGFDTKELLKEYIYQRDFASTDEDAQLFSDYSEGKFLGLPIVEIITRADWHLHITPEIEP